jgi:hypothetical protein
MSGVPTAPKDTGVLWIIMPNITAASAGKPTATISGAGHRGRRAEARRALDERAEQPRDEDDLHAPIRADAREPAADAGDAARVLQRVQQQQRAEDDPQHLTVMISPSSVAAATRLRLTPQASNAIAAVTK